MRADDVDDSEECRRFVQHVGPRDGDGDPDRGCTGSSEPSTTPAEPSPTVDASTAASSPSPSPAITLRDFPAFPDQPFSERVAASLQGCRRGSGGVRRHLGRGDRRGRGALVRGGGGRPPGESLTAGSLVPIASIGKTVTAAQVLRLVEEGGSASTTRPPTIFLRSSTATTQTEPRSGSCSGCAVASATPRPTTRGPPSPSSWRCSQRSMWSVASRFSEPSTAARTFAGRLSRPPRPPGTWEIQPNLVATTT